MHAPLRQILAALVVCACLVVMLPPPAAAQDELASLRLLSQPIWHRAGDELGIEVEVRNNGLAELEGLTLTVAAHARVTNRSSLHTTFEDGVDLPDLSTLPVPVDEAVAPGAATTVEIDLSVTDLASLAGATETGPFPMTISLVGAGGSILDSFVTTLLYYPSAPEQRLMVVPVLPLNGPVARGPDNVFGPGEDGEYPLERATAADGWLHGLVTALGDTAGELPPIVTRERERVGRGRRRRVRVVRTETPQPAVHLGLAVTPRLVEELADLADGFTRETEEGTEEIAAGAEVASAARDVLTGLQQLLREEGVQPLLVPYAFPDLPSLSALLGPEETGLQLDQGIDVLSEALNLETDPGWLFPPAGRLDATTLAGLRTDSARHTFFTEDTLARETEEPETCPEGSPSFTCAVSVRSASGGSSGFMADPGLQERLSALGNGDDRLALQRFFAETSMIHEELPGTPGRVVQFTIPSLWQPRPRLASLFLEGLRTAPWLRTATPKEAIRSEGVELRPQRLVTTAPALRDLPDSGYFDAIREAAALVASFDLVRPPSELVRRLLRNVLVAQSRMWWRSSTLQSVGAGFAASSTARARKELGHLTLGGPADVTLTSRRGEVLFVVSNEAKYPATFGLRVDPSRSDVDIEPRDFEDQRIGPGITRQFTLTARTHSVISPIEVQLTTPDGSYVIANKVINIRSTDFNNIAVGITVGAFAFLVLFYIARAIRRRRAAPAQ